MSKKILVIWGLVILIGAIGLWWYSFSHPQKMVYREKCVRLATSGDCVQILPYNPSPSEIATTATNPTQEGRVDEHLVISNTLRDINFCGKLYKVKQIIIDDIDVVQRIAEIATTEPKYGESICRIAYNSKNNGWLVGDEIAVTASVNKTSLGTKTYRINIMTSFIPRGESLENASHIGDFEINPNTEIINIILMGYAETSKEYFGKLK